MWTIGEMIYLGKGGIKGQVLSDRILNWKILVSAWSNFWENVKVLIDFLKKLDQTLRCRDPNRDDWMRPSVYYTLI